MNRNDAAQTRSKQFTASFTAASSRQNASQLFARFIWESVEQEIRSATDPAVIKNAIARFSAVLDDAPATSSIWSCIDPNDLNTLQSQMRDQEHIWTAEVDDAFSRVFSQLLDGSNAPPVPALGKMTSGYRDTMHAAPRERDPVLNGDGRATFRATPSGSARATMSARPNSQNRPTRMGASRRTLGRFLAAEQMGAFLLAAHPKSGPECPASKLRSQPNVLRVIYEYLAKVPFSQRYMLGPQLGIGGHSEVHEARHFYRSPNRVFAVKHVQKKMENEFQVEMLRREATIIRSLDHNYILKVFDYVEDEGSCYLVTPKMGGGDMLERILAQPGKHFPESVAAKYVAKIIDALGFLHSKGIVHRDVKPENILFQNAKPKSDIALVDFGFAQSGVQGNSLFTACGTPEYAAPEILSGQPHGKEVDAWSLGVMTYVMLCGYPPFYHEDEKQLFRIIKSGKYEFNSPAWDPISRNAKDFIRQCLMLDPTNRITMEQAKRHAWVSAHVLTRTNSSASLNRPRARGRSRTVVTAFQLPKQQQHDEPAPRATISAAKSTLDEVNELLGLDDSKKRNLHRSRSTRPGRPTTAAATSGLSDSHSEIGGSPPDRSANARLLTAKNTGDKIDFSLPKTPAPAPAPAPAAAVAAATRPHSPVRNNLNRMTLSSTPRTSDSSDSSASAARPIRKRNSMVEDLPSRSMTLPSNLPNGLEGLESPGTTDDDYSRADAFSDTSSLHGEPWSRPRIMSTVKEEPEPVDDRPQRALSPKPYGAGRRASTSTTASTTTATTTTATTVTELLTAPDEAQSPKRRDSIKSIGGVTGGTEKALRDQIAALQQEVQGLNALVVKQAQKIARLKAGERGAAAEKVLLPGEVFYRLEDLQRSTHDSTIMANFKELYLSDQEFTAVFRMPKAEFAQLPSRNKWELKREHRIC